MHSERRLGSYTAKTSGHWHLTEEDKNIRKRKHRKDFMISSVGVLGGLGFSREDTCVVIGTVML